MQMEQSRWSETRGWTPSPPGTLTQDAQFILLFGGRTCIPELALLIRCVGWRLVLKQRIEAYGEISPFHLAATSELHNHTMTITPLSELL